MKRAFPDIYRQLVEGSPVGLILVRTGKVVFINQTGAALLGRSPDSIVGRPFVEFVHPRDQRLFSGEDSLLGWGKASFRLADGSEVPLGVRTTTLNRDEHACSLVILRDLGEEHLSTPASAIRYKTLVEKLADVVFVINLAGRFVFLNQGFTRATGYSRGEWIGRHFTEILAPEYVDSTMHHFRTGPPPGGVSQYEIAIIAKDGRKIPLEIRVTSLRDEEGDEIGRIGTARDISERHRFEETLRRKNEELGMILNSMGEGVVVLDAGHRMVSLNRKARELFGYPPEEIIGKDYTFWCHPDFLGELKARLSAREAGKDETYEVRFRRKDGSSFYAQVTAVPVFDEAGEFQGSIGCLRDVTQERTLARKIEELNELNRRLIELADVWINVVDREGKVILWNREAERISGYSREEVLGNAEIWERLFPDPTYRLQIREKQCGTGMKDEASRREESTIRTKSGEERIISWHGRPLRLADGSDGWLVVGHDVTDQRRREARLHEYAAEIERLSKERNHLFSMAAHKLRTPLTIIRGFVDLVLRDGGLSEKQIEWLEKVQDETDRLGRLVTHLLDIARLDGGKERLAPRCVRLSPIVEHVLRTLTPMLAKDGRTISYQPPRMNTEVYADPQAVEQILFNLLSNAIAYTPPPGRIAIDVTAGEQTVQVNVVDEGIGISPQERERIFGEFYRTHAAREMKRDGSGVGLSVVKRLVQHSGGKIWVESAGIGKGSTFSFTLPRCGEGMVDAHIDHRG